MPNVHFTVDAALFRELGERLVGKPHIALAELIKNSFDADATRVEILFTRNKIVIKDNGHGMTGEAFRDFWMRIGSPHKGREKASPKFNRRLTGSKGVGRLAVQFLASNIRIRTVSVDSPERETVGRVDWDEAVKAKELTSAVADISEREARKPYPGRSRHGTSIVLTGLKHRWSSKELKELAKEVWWLQPPFKLEGDDRTSTGFKVELRSAQKDLVTAFEGQMSAILNLWHAKLTGKMTEIPKGRSRTGHVSFSLEFADGTRHSQEFPIDRCLLHHLEFEIRIFDLRQKQRAGVKVEQAREYLNDHGGVLVYDSGFHLPYYGHETDWLHIERDHSHRLSKSKLLPKGLQVTEGLTHLPTNTRILGVVHVDSNLERRLSQDLPVQDRLDHLSIQITRDRLIDNRAFEQLRDAVRWAVDFYAMRQAERIFETTTTSVEPLRTAARRVKKIDEILSHYKRLLPTHAREALHHEIDEVISSIKQEKAHGVAQAGLLGALATAGIAAIAFQHELNKQFASLEDIKSDIAEIGDQSGLGRKLKKLSSGIDDWISRARATRALFAHVAEEENRKDARHYRAQPILETVKRNLGVLVRGIRIELDGIDPELRLPSGTFAEWSSIFQNVILNAVNAMVDSERRVLTISTTVKDGEAILIFQDTGTGVDLKRSEELFKPFVRKTTISPERKALGYGGTGLGLTIVRMIAEKVHCAVQFKKPRRGYATAFSISWRSEQ